MSFLRPLARREAKTRRPLAVAIRWRKPCLLFRLRLWGWNVLFIVVLYRYYYYSLGNDLSHQRIAWAIRGAKLAHFLGTTKKSAYFSHTEPIFTLFSAVKSGFSPKTLQKLLLDYCSCATRLLILRKTLCLFCNQRFVVEVVDFHSAAHICQGVGCYGTRIFATTTEHIIDSRDILLEL